MGKYLNESLVNDEKIVEQGKVSGIILLPHIILICVGVGLFTIWKPLIAMLTTELAVTNKKILGKKGFIKTEEMNSPLNTVQNVKVSNGLWGKIFKYGKIDITTTSGTYSFDYIKNANEFKAIIMAQIDNKEKDAMNMNAQAIANALKNN